MADQFEKKKIASETGLTNEIVLKYKDMGDGTHAPVFSGTGDGGGGGSSLADTSVVDAAGVYWLVRDDGTTLTYRNWATGATGTPTAPVEPVGAGAGNEISTANYTAKTAAANYAIGDVVQRVVVLDLTSIPAVVLGATWVNLTSGLVITTPNMAHLDLIDDQNMAISGTVAITSTDLGTTTDAVAGTDTGTFSLISLFKRALQNGTSILARLPALINNTMPVTANNFDFLLRDSFQTYPGTNWTTVAAGGSGDIIQVCGNAAGASYLVISKDPLSAGLGSETIIESNATFSMPIELAFGMHMSQRTLGQEFSVECVSTEAPAPIAELTISSIQQATTNLTVTTTTPHNLKVGVRIGIYGVSDSRLNYSEIVVATTPSPTQFTANAGPMGAIASVTAGPFNAGFVYVRPAMGFSPNGTSIVLENGNGAQASFYVKSENGDVFPIGGTGTLGANQSSTITTTASVQPAVAANNYNFRPSAEYRLSQMADRLQWQDNGIDTNVQAASRAAVNQVCPNPAVTYKVRFRARNNKALTTPVAKIISAAKTGTTTATITTDVAHGLTTGDVINIYGVRDQTNFPNLTAATAVASVVNATTFTVVQGTASTTTSYGGYVSRVNGGQVQQGAITQAVQSASITTSLLTLVGSAAWTGVLIGDYVNLYGCRDNSTGADVGIDGIFRVRDIQTTNLVLEPIGSTSIPATLGSVNCGGGVLKRTDMRISYIRLFSYERLRVEALSRPGSDAAYAMPVAVNNTPAVTVSSGTVTAVTAANLNVPGIIVDIASAALTTTTTTAASTPTFGTEYEVNIPVTAVSGTTPTLDVVVQESDDAGTNWYDVYHFPRITATGMYRSPKLPLKGNRIRYVQTVAGTTPSFTRAINRLQGSFNGARWIRRIFDRAISLTTLNATTTTAAGQPLNIQECRNVQLVINLGAATTPPALQLEGSDDNGASWYAIGTPLTAVASSTVQLIVNNINAELVRARVSTAGVGVTAVYTEIKAW